MISFFRKVQWWLQRTHKEEEMREELDFHLDLSSEEYTAQGIPPAEARARAHREFGNTTRIREVGHDLFSFHAFEQLLKDVSYAAREIKRSPWLTAVAVLSLAVGIAAVTTTASIIDALFLRGLPVHEPHRLVAFSKGTAAAWSRWRYGEFRQWADAADAPFTLAAVYTLSDLEQPLLPASDGRLRGTVHVSLVSGGYFDVLQVTMASGRPITPMDDRVPGLHPVAVISHGFWIRQFGQSPAIIGSAFKLNDVSYQVIGVASEGFTGEWVGQPTDVWLPLAMHAEITRSRNTVLRDDSPAQWLRLIARLNDQTSIVQATAAANVIRQRAGHQGYATPQASNDAREPLILLSVATGYAPARRQYAKPLTIVSVIVAIVLVVGCANFSNLLYARSRSRQHEYAVRLALGAGRWQIVRQALVECCLLASVSAALGMVAAAWVAMGVAKNLSIASQPIEVDLHLDAGVLSITAGCVGLVILFGFISSLRCLRHSVPSLARAALRESRRDLVGRLFLVGQLALCVVLLIGTGLMLRTIANLRTQELGFDRNVLLVTVVPIQAGYSSDAAAGLVQRIRERLLGLSDIRAVSLTGVSLMDNNTYWIDASERLTVEGRALVPGASWTFADVGAGYCGTIGMPILLGRDFTETDVTAPSDAVIVNQSMAKLLFGNDDPLSQRIAMTPTAPQMSVVGVVNDARQTSPRDRGLPVLYRPLRHIPSHVVLAVRTRGNAADSVDVVRHHLLDMDRNLPIGNVQTIEAVLDQTIGQERLLARLATWLGLLIVVVSCVGLHAVIAKDVFERTHEIGVRMALGATRARIAGVVLRDAAILAALAFVAGVPLALAAVMPLSSQLYGVKWNDPGTIVVSVLLLLSVAVIAAVRPAHWAARVDPMVALRCE